METVIKFKVIKEDGSKKSIKVKYTDCPDFTEFTRVANFTKHLTKDGFIRVTFGEVVEGDTEQFNFTTTVGGQIDEWVASLNKSDWMFDKEIMTILNWEVISYTGMKVDEVTGETSLQTIQTKEVTIKEQKLTPIENMKLFFVLNKEQISQEFVDNYTVLYADLADNIKDFPWEKQMGIVFKVMGIASTAASTALQSITDYSQALKQVDWSKHKMENGDWDMDAISREAKMIQNGHIVDSTRIISNTK